MSDSLSIERLVGGQIVDRLEDLARLRTEVFREFPYLYLGSMEYEREYLETYIRSPESIIVLVHEGERIVGASSGIPLAHEVEEFRRPFEEHGYDIQRIFYCGESVLLPEYRGKGLGIRFFQERESHALSLGRFDLSCFCAVERPEHHPRRPPNYKPLDPFWRRRGYEEHPQLRTRFSWRDLDEEAESEKPMVFWVRGLEKG